MVQVTLASFDCKKLLEKKLILNDVVQLTMPKNYAYRIDHDTGFAPHIEKNICIMSGCKINTIEKWATEGSWVIGIGGNNTGKPDKLMYAMKVAKNISFEQFKEDYPEESGYLDSRYAGENVLISYEFYYFGDKAIDLPADLKRIIIKYQGCKCVSESDVAKLCEYIESKGYRYGKIGNPNNSNYIT